MPCDVQRLKWSPDDNLIMCVNTLKGVLHLRAVTNKVISCNLEGWSGHIEEEMLAAALWTPDSRQIITFTELQLRATVWSLGESAATAHIRAPKLLPPRGVDFSTNGKFMALLERRECKDWLSIYYAGLDFKLTNAFELAGGDIFDAADAKWTM